MPELVGIDHDDPGEASARGQQSAGRKQTRRCELAPHAPVDSRTRYAIRREEEEAQLRCLWNSSLPGAEPADAVFFSTVGSSAESSVGEECSLSPWVFPDEGIPVLPLLGFGGPGPDFDPQLQHFTFRSRRPTDSLRFEG